MKIDNVIFCASEYYAPFWNIQSRVWKTKFGINPILLLFSNKSLGELNLSEKYGQVIPQTFIEGLPDIIQIQFKKFWYPGLELDKTAIIGDIDQIPLQTDHFLNGLEMVDENAYAHFNYSLCSQMMGIDRNSAGKIYSSRGGYVNGGFDLPGHYHCAKGKYFSKLYFDDQSFEDVINKVISSKRYGMIKQEEQKNLNANIHGTFWVAEEMYTSEHLWYGFKNKTVSGLYLKDYHIWDGKIDRVGRFGRQWNGTNYVYDENKIRNKGYVDIHCHRPYHEQEKALIEVLTKCEMI